MDAEQTDTEQTDTEQTDTEQTDTEQMDANQMDAEPLMTVDADSIDMTGPDPAPTADGKADDGRVIEIGWQVLLIPLVVMAVVGGYWVGKQFNRSPSQLQAGAPSVDPANGINPLEIQSDPNRAPIIITLEPSQLEQFGGSQGGFGDAPMALPPPSHPLMGQPAPDFVMKRLSDGQEVKISDLKGKTVMVNFWATWCPPCRLEMPWLESVYGKHKDQGFELLAVDAGEKVPPSMVEDQVKQFVERMGLTFPTLLGDNTYDVQREYSVYGLPSTFIIDPNGTVIDYHNGMYPNEATLEAQIQKAFGSAENAEN